MKRITRFAKLLSVALLIGLVLCEIGLRVAVSYVPAEASQQRLPSQAIMTSLTATLRDYGTLDDNGAPAFKDVTLPGFTIRHYNRVTTDQPVSYSRTVWVFGSSTVWGAYVDDAHTIPSYLQREFNARGLPWRVVNVGQPHLSAEMEYYWLTQEPIQSGDFVIFLDGSVDTNLILQKDFNALQDATLACLLSRRVPLLILNFLCQSQTVGRGSYIPAAMDDYRRMIDKATSYTRKHEALFLHVMQPLMPHDQDISIAAGHGDLQTVIASDDYFDEYHYDDDGHAAIAAQIGARFGMF